MKYHIPLRKNRGFAALVLGALLATAGTASAQQPAPRGAPTLTTTPRKGGPAPGAAPPAGGTPAPGAAGRPPAGGQPAGGQPAPPPPGGAKPPAGGTGTGPGAGAGTAGGDADPMANVKQAPKEIEFQPKGAGALVNFNLDEADLPDLVKAISNITGRRFIYGGKLRQIKATVYSPSKVTAGEAYAAFLSILQQ